MQKIDGVVAYYDHKDIPGPNTFIPADANTNFNPNTIFEELFCSGTIRYYYQPVGLIVAVNRDIGKKASNLVQITYSPGATPYFDIRQILNENVTSRIHHERSINATSRGN